MVEKGIKLARKCFFKKIFRKTKLDFNDIFYPWKNSEGEIGGEDIFIGFLYEN